MKIFNENINEINNKVFKYGRKYSNNFEYYRN